MNKIELSYNKTLKLTNVLICEFELTGSSSFEHTVIQMENYIKSKGYMPIGPLIQNSSCTINEEGQVEMKAYLMRQANSFINHIDSPYKFESILKVKNCIYARYTGPSEKLKFAYDKINVAAFEDNIELSNENYTIFVDQQEDDLVADVFVERKSNE